MKNEQLLDLMGMVAEDLIVEAAEEPVRKRPIWPVATVAAAAIVMCVGVRVLPAMQPAGTAAPESQFAVAGTNGNVLMDAVTDGAIGYMTDGDYAHRTEESKHTAPEAAEDMAGAAMGFFEPVFRTEQGGYMLVGEELPLMAELPNDVRYLGELALTASDEVRYPSVGTKELLGCAVWQSEDGEYLYIQSPEGGWLQATRQK